MRLRQLAPDFIRQSPFHWRFAHATAAQPARKPMSRFKRVLAPPSSSLWELTHGPAYYRTISRQLVPISSTLWRTWRENMDIARTKPKLKFGIERILAEEPPPPPPQPETRCSAVSKPLVPVPCSDCVTSLFRCCRLSPSGGCAQDAIGEFFGQHHGFGGATTPTSTSGLFAVHPIRPFATRPGTIGRVFSISKDVVMCTFVP